MSQKVRKPDKENKVSNENKKENKHKPIFTAISIVVLLLLGAAVFFGTYYIMIDKSTSSYEKEMDLAIKQITEENKKVGAYNKNLTIDPEKAKENLEGNISKLKSIKDLINTEVPTEKYRLSHRYLIDGLNNNISLYRQILVMLQNPGSKDIERSLTSLAKFEEDCEKNYSLFSVKSLKIALPNEAKNFIKNTNEYLTEVVRINKDLEIQNSQNVEFTESMDKVIEDFEEIKTDFSSLLERARDGRDTFENVISTMDSYKDKYLALKEDFSTIAVPQNARKTQNYFNSVLDDYSLFLQEIKFAVSSEKDKTSDKPLQGATLKVIYAASNERYLTMDNNFNNFLKIYNDFKENFIKQ
jgi:hypothetical protein